MILEVAILNVKSDMMDDFECAFEKAQKIIAQMDGYINHQLQKSVETRGRYILLVNWRSIEDHEIGFRQSAEYKEWRTLLHHFYDPFPDVEHYEKLFQSGQI